LSPNKVFSWRWFLAWLLAYPLAAWFVFFCTTNSSYPFFFPYLVAALLFTVPMLALVTGAITQSLKASLLGMMLGLPLALGGAVLISDHWAELSHAQWNAEYNEFQAFGTVVLADDPGKIAAALKGLQHFTPAETMCVLRSGRANGGGEGYLLPDGPQVPDAGRKLRNGEPYVIPTDRLYLVAEAVVDRAIDPHEKRLALFQLLQALAEREESPDLRRWQTLWNRVGPAPVNLSDMVMTDSPMSDYCNNYIDEHRLKKLLPRVATYSRVR
jgi:hypothetical protein